MTIPLVVQGQTRDLPSIDWGKNIVANDSVVLVTGFRYAKDGYGQVSTVQAFDAALNPKWTFTLDAKHTNTVDRILIRENRIFLTGLEGERDRRSLKTDRYVKILDMNGSQLLHKNLGPSTYPCTNLGIDGDVLFFGYQRCETPLFADMMSKSKNIVVELDVKRNTVKFKEHTLVRSKPDFITKEGDNYLMFGTQYKDEKFKVTETFVVNFSSPVQTSVLPAERMENVAKVATSKNGSVIVSYSNPFVENQEKYLRFDYVDNQLRLKKTKEIKFSTLNWRHMYLEFPSVENEFWFYVFRDGNNAFFLKLDEEGNQLEEIKSNILDGSQDFCLTKRNVYHLYKTEEKVSVTRIKR